MAVDLARLVAQQVPGILLFLLPSSGIIGIMQIALHCCDKHHDQKAACRENGLFGLHVLIMLNLCGKSEQRHKHEQRQEPLRSGICWLVLYGSLSLFLVSGQVSRCSTTHSQLGLLTIINHELSPQTCPLFDPKEVFFQLRFPLPRWHGSCQVHKKLTKGRHTLKGTSPALFYRYWTSNSAPQACSASASPD